MTYTFEPATREQAKARIALAGPPGSGKTFTGLTMLTAMASRLAVIDTERRSASLYAGGQHGGFSFDVLRMTSFDPRELPKALAAAAHAGYDGLLIDSLSHFWSGAGGMLELVDSIGKRASGGDRSAFGGWKDARPHERAMIDALIAYPGHLVVTLRTKVEWLIDDSGPKKKITKVGTKAEQREGIEYEFDIVGDMDQENTLVVSKSRCPALSGQVIQRPGADVAADILEWLNDGVEMADPATYLDRAVAVDASMADMRELLKEVTGRQLNGSAVLHPVTGTPTTLGAVIFERGQYLLAAAARPATAAPAVPEPHATPDPDPNAPTLDELLDDVRAAWTNREGLTRLYEDIRHADLLFTNVELEGRKDLFGQVVGTRIEELAAPGPATAAPEPTARPNPLPLLLDAIREGWTDPASLAACRQTATEQGLLAREVATRDGGTIALHRMIDGQLADLNAARPPQQQQQSTSDADDQVPAAGEWGVPQGGVMATPPQCTAIASILGALGIAGDRPRRLAIVTGILSRASAPVPTMKALTLREAGVVIEALSAVQRQPEPEWDGAIARYEAAAATSQAA